VVNPDGRVEPRDVKLGVESPNRVEILAGLREGEQVVVGNLGSYQAGEQVKPKPAVTTSFGGASKAE